MDDLKKVMVLYILWNEKSPYGTLSDIWFDENVTVSTVWGIKE